MPPVTLDLLARTSVVIPTLNEAASIGKVIEELPKGLLEVLIVDGNSTDGTQSEAQARGARVVVEPRKGYGRAYKTGFLEARGAFIATLDGDLTYPAERVGELVGRLDEGRLDFITCDRLTTLRREAMSGKHRFGNFVLSLTTRVLFGVPVRDSQSGMWVFRREVLKDLTLTADGMPFSEELKVEAFRARRGRCLEVPIEYRVRIGEAVLSTWSDGFHNLAFLFGKRFGRPKGTRGELYGAPQP
ncbi:MAG TPA: glycosyltransferase family 2 protein [Candidatus Thermoplasmatota archaeon]|nr:glycosyltransferase family 2 protein [Candidatus Thermoplasmatota archaeon]